MSYYRRSNRSHLILLGEELKRARMAYNNGNLLAAADAYYLCADMGLAAPEWIPHALIAALGQGLGSLCNKKTGRQSSALQYQRDNIMHGDRYDAVMRARAAGAKIGWTKAKGLLAGTHSDGDVQSIKRSCRIVGDGTKSGVDPSRLWMPRSLPVISVLYKTAKPITK